MFSKEKMNFKPKRFELDPDEEIVISGVSGRYANARNISELAHNLYNKVNMVSDIEVRWKRTNPQYPRYAGLTSDLDKFDASFFGIQPKLATCMDPQARAILEHAYEAIIDAGICPKVLKNSRTGVYIGVCFSESEMSWIYERDTPEGAGLSGNSRALIANRISFMLGLNGPSFVVDTACSSSMYAIDCAYRAIQTGQCDAAIVGGANLLLHPLASLQFAK